LLEWPEDVGLAGVTYAQDPESLPAQYIESINELYAEVHSTFFNSTNL
jgi:hypothetical protein